MKFIVLFILSFSLFGKTVIISDIDDTIRKTNNLSFGGFNSNFFSKNAFNHMANIYHDFSRQKDLEFFYITAAPKIAYNATKWLKAHNFPEGEVYQRSMFKDTFEFKSKLIVEQISKMENVDSIIMFGDNASEDPRVYIAVCEQVKITKCWGFIRDVRVDKMFDYQNKRWLDAVDEKNLRFFMSESDLVKTLSEYLSQQTVESIKNDLKLGILVPEYIWKTMSERMTKADLALAKDLYNRDL